MDEHIKKAQAAWKKKDATTTVKALEQALDEARTAAPLEIRAAVVINHNHTGLGVYTPATGDVVEGRVARLYVEVANHAHTKVSSAGTPERWRVQLDVSGDFSYEDVAENGSVEVMPLQQGVSLGSQSFETRTTSGVTSFGVEIKLGDKSPAGTYRVALKVKDAVGGKSATKAVKVVLK